MVGIELPQGLIALQLSVYAARLRLVERVRANGPTREWSAGAYAEGADLQHACEVSEAVLQEAIDESGLEQQHSRRVLRRALMAAAAQQMPARPKAAPSPKSHRGKEIRARLSRRQSGLSLL